ncbi:Not4hp/Mot2p [Cryptosporidium ryanae]|uniref:Not4hp/Mot2p n=1 Tax=Cryptosporidium ryanae TaxID=515981 RepID=UPI00351A0F07|nr:Not4hp/Mot2p [Cryptosporidium ryanae]
MEEKLDADDNVNILKANSILNNNEVNCPLCMEEMDETDKNFYPCKCRYQICLWCFYHVRDQLDNKCPACRQQYDDKLTISSNRDNLCIYKEEQGFNWCGNAVSRTPTITSSSLGSNTNKNDDKLSKNNTDYENKVRVVINDNKLNSNLEDMRIIQRNLVYVVGLNYSVAKREILSCENMFGRYGKILNMRILPNDNDTCSAFITYSDELSATKAIKNTNGKKIFGQNVIRCSFGTNKYCINFIKGINCNNSNCAYVHNIVEPNDCISKSELINFHSSNKFALKPLRELKNTTKNDVVVNSVNQISSNNSGSNSTSTICTTSSIASNYNTSFNVINNNSNSTTLFSNQNNLPCISNKEKEARSQKNRGKRNVNNCNVSNISECNNYSMKTNKSHNTKYSENSSECSPSESSSGDNLYNINVKSNEKEFNDNNTVGGSLYSNETNIFIDSDNTSLLSVNTTSNIENKYNNSTQNSKINSEQVNLISQNTISSNNSNMPITVQSIQNPISPFSLQGVLFGNIKTNTENISNDAASCYINSTLDNELEFELNIEHDIQKVIDEDCIDFLNKRIEITDFSVNKTSSSGDSNFINFGSTTLKTSSCPFVSKTIIEENSSFSDFLNGDNKNNNIDINSNDFIKSSTQLYSSISTNNILNFSSKSKSIQNNNIKKKTDFNVNSSNKNNNSSNNSTNTSFIDSISVLRSIMPHANITIQGQ